ncbi:MAG: prepilin-type N-terminal cleavage/methylation domain-containing protein [Planctomycetota bacterium]|jgi:prepilin-type N-terminal cleavage/methylation domain-containing protein
MKSAKNRSAFTLVELMIVVAVIAIIASAAIPSLISSKKIGHESSAIATLRAVNTSEELYHARFGSYGSIGDLSAAGFIDEVVGAGVKSGYNYASANIGTNTWSCTAVPSNIGVTGDRGFYVDHTGVIRATADGTPPNASSPGLD